MGTRRLVSTLCAVVLTGCSATPDVNGPALVRDYPRLTPWRLEGPADPDATTLRIAAFSGACVNVAGDQVGFEPLAHVEVEELPERVVISAWLGEPATPQPVECAGVSYSLPAEVHLEQPLGSRQIVDQACDLPEFHQHTGCVEGD